MSDPQSISLCVTGLVMVGLLSATLLAMRRNRRRLSLFEGRPAPTRTHPGPPQTVSRQARFVYERDTLRPS